MLAKRSKVRSRVCFLEEDRWRLVARAKSHQAEHLAQGVGCEAGLKKDALLVGHIVAEPHYDVKVTGLFARRRALRVRERVSFREHLFALHEIFLSFYRIDVDEELIALRMNDDAALIGGGLDRFSESTVSVAHR